MAEADRDKVQGALWAEIRNKVRDAKLSAEDKVKMMRFLSGKAQEAADADRDPDLDGKLADMAVAAHETAGTLVEKTADLANKVANSSAYVASNDQSAVRALHDSAKKLRAEAENVRKIFEPNRPNIVQRIGTLADGDNDVRHGYGR